MNSISFSIIDSTFSHKNEPFLIEFPYNYSINNFTIQNRNNIELDISNNITYLILFGNITNGKNLFYIYSSNETYENLYDQKESIEKE